MNERPPLTLTQKEMAARYRDLTPKLELVDLGGAMYVRHCGEWWLLDAEKHGYGPLQSQS